MKGKYLLRKILGISLTTIASLLFFGFTVNMVEKGVDTDDIVGLVILVIVPMILGVWLIVSANKKNRLEIFEDREREILLIARQRSGKLTASELSMNSKLSLREAENILADFHRRGYALIGHADNGAIVYDFHELLSVQDKSNSKNMFD